MWNTSNATQPSPDASAPTTAGIGTLPPEIVTDSGTLYGRARSRSRNRKAMIDTCAIVNANSAPNA